MSTLQDDIKLLRDLSDEMWPDRHTYILRVCDALDAAQLEKQELTAKLEASLKETEVWKAKYLEARSSGYQEGREERPQIPDGSLAVNKAGYEELTSKLDDALAGEAQFKKVAEGFQKQHLKVVRECHELREALQFLVERIGTTDHENSSCIDEMFEKARKALENSPYKE